MSTSRPLPNCRCKRPSRKLSGNADLRVRGTADRPVIMGRVEVLEGGQSPSTERNTSLIAVMSPSPIPPGREPIIDLQASTRVRDYDITVQLQRRRQRSPTD